jgi:hypothetical protein
MAATGPKGPDPAIAPMLTVIAVDRILGLQRPSNVVVAPINLLRGKKGEIQACEVNALILLDSSPQYADVHHDDFLGRMRIGDRDWTDTDDRATLCWLQAEFEVPKFTLGHVRNAIAALARAAARLADAVDQRAARVGRNASYRIRTV